MIVPGVGAYRIRPSNIPQGMNVPPRYVHSAPFGGVRDACQVYQGRLREFPQVSRHLPWRLRRQRGVSRRLPWRLRRRRGVSRHLPWRLRKRRKSLGVCRGVCAGSAGSLGVCRGVCAGGAGSLGICRGVCASGVSLSAFARPGFLTALPRAGRWGVCWASSRRPTRGERERRRRGLHSARSAGC